MFCCEQDSGLRLRKHEQQRWCARSETPFKSFMSLPIASALARTLMFCSIFDLACSITRQVVAEMQSWNDRVYIIKAVSFRISLTFSGSVLDKTDTRYDFKTLWLARAHLWAPKMVQISVDKIEEPTIDSRFLSTAFGTTFGSQKWAPQHDTA